MTVDALLEQIKSNNADARTKAWRSAGEVGGAAIQPLVSIWTGDGELEVRRAACRAVWQIVHHAGRPGAESERKSVVSPLVAALDAQQDLQAQRDLMWMLSGIAGDEAIAPVAARLAKPELRDDARMVLQRLPGEASLQALKAAYAAADSNFRVALADSLRHRGASVPKGASQRLVPTRKTTVKAAGR